MKTARNFAHELLGIVTCPTVTPSADCDRLTAAIEARDAEHDTVSSEILMSVGGMLNRERDEARHRLADAEAENERLRGALERLGRETCAYDGSYANCWEAIEADDIDAGEGIPCARCVSLQALESVPDKPAAPIPQPAPAPEVAECETIACGSCGRLRPWMDATPTTCPHCPPGHDPKTCCRCAATPGDGRERP